MFVDMQSSNSSSTGPTTETKPGLNSDLPLELREDFDKRDYRPLDVDVSIIMHDIQAHLLKVIFVFTAQFH